MKHALTPWNWFGKDDDDHASRSGRGRSPHSPMAYADPVQRAVDRFFGHFYGPNPGPDGVFSSDISAAPGESGIFLKPRLDVSASDDAYHVSVEVPGVDDSNLHVEVADNVLIISGEKQKDQMDDGRNYYRRERSYGSFRRVLSLPEDADRDNLKATHKNGILSVSIPRREVQNRDRKVVEIAKN